MTEGRSFPVFAAPEKKLTVNDMKALLRNHYEDHWFDPYSLGLKTDTPRPISVFRTYESHVMQVRPELPVEIGEVTYLAMGMSALSCYVPFYHGSRRFPQNMVKVLTRQTIPQPTGSIESSKRL